MLSGASNPTTAAQRTLALAVLRGAFLDLLASGDGERTGAAVALALDALTLRLTLHTAGQWIDVELLSRSLAAASRSARPADGLDRERRAVVDRRRSLSRSLAPPSRSRSARSADRPDRARRWSVDRRAAQLQRDAGVAPALGALS